VSINLDEYTRAEMMIIATARQVRDGESTIVGMGPPLLSAALAKYHHAPNMWYCTESGPLDWIPTSRELPAPIGIADHSLTQGSAMSGDMVDALGAFVNGGWAQSAVLQAAQIDRFGNLNTMLAGTFEDPIRRLPGTGGNADIGASVERVISTMPLETRRFKERADFRTTAGYIDGPGGRAEAGLAPQGPNKCATTMCVFKFDTEDGGTTGSCEMVLEQLFPGVSLEEVQTIIPWKLKVSQDLTYMDPPTEEELVLLRHLDDGGNHLIPGRY
jgi:acyl CoA:acetate/3-ketoacid CoA transferase beta subunit